MYMYIIQTNGLVKFGGNLYGLLIMLKEYTSIDLCWLRNMYYQ